MERRAHKEHRSSPLNRKHGLPWDEAEALYKWGRMLTRRNRDGEPHLSRGKSGRVIEYSPYRGGMWSLSSKNLVNSPRLSVHLEWLLGQFEPRAAAVRMLLANGV